MINLTIYVVFSGGFGHLAKSYMKTQILKENVGEKIEIESISNDIHINY